MSERTQYSDSNQPINRRGKSTRTLVLEGIQKMVEEEHGTGITKEKARTLLFEKIAQRAFDNNDKDSPMFLKLMMDKGWSATKPTHELYQFEFPDNAGPTEQAEAIKKSIAEGKLPIDVGQHMMSMIADSIKIKEIDEIEKRLKALEENAQ